MYKERIAHIYARAKVIRKIKHPVKEKLATKQRNNSANSPLRTYTCPLECRTAPRAKRQRILKIFNNRRIYTHTYTHMCHSGNKKQLSEKLLSVLAFNSRTSTIYIARTKTTRALWYDAARWTTTTTTKAVTSVAVGMSDGGSGGSIGGEPQLNS